jgi:hypothetical protein
MVPRYVPIASALRGLLGPVMDAGMARDRRLVQAVLATDTGRSTADAR